MNSDDESTPTFETRRLPPSDSPPIDQLDEGETGDPVHRRRALAWCGILLIAIWMVASSLILLATL